MQLPLSPMRRHDRVWAELASAALDGELNDSETERFRIHSAACARCQLRISQYRRQALLLRTAFDRPTPPSAQSILAAASGRGRSRWHDPVTARRLAMAVSLGAILVAVIASPAIRDSAAGIGSDLRRAVSPASQPLRAGQPGSETASSSNMAAAGSGLRLYRADAGGGHAFAIGDALIGRGALYVLADGRVLSRSSDDGSSERWSTIAPDGSTQPFAAATGADVLDVTPDGERILVRDRAASGDYSTDPGATLVVDTGGSVIWQDPGGADVYSLSPDGRYALSGDSVGLREIPLDGGDSTLIPLDRHPVHRPQLSRDGTRAVFLAERLGHGDPDLALAYARVGDGNYAVLSGGPVSTNPPPPFRLSADGRYLAAETGAGPGVRALTIYDIDAGSAAEVPALRGAEIRALSWSPDSRRLLILASRGARDEAWIRSEDGSLSSAASGGNIASAAWLTDSSGIVFAER